MTIAGRIEMHSRTNEPCRHHARSELYGGLLERCDACGLVRTTSRPNFRYDEAYFTQEGAGGYDFSWPFILAQDASRFVAELRHLETHGPPGSLLDVGCATGVYLGYAQARGWEIAGVEVAEFARREASRKLGVEIAPSLASLPAGTQYDVVTLHHVLEHLDDPVAVLRDDVRPRVRKLLLLEVPNFDSLASRVHGPRWRDLRPDQHVHHLTPATIRALAVQAGFRPTRVYTRWDPFWTLRTAVDALLLLPGLLRPRRDARVQATMPAREPIQHRWPRGARRIGDEITRVAMRPLIRVLEAAHLGQRLILEAEPASAVDLP